MSGGDRRLRARRARTPPSPRVTPGRAGGPRRRAVAIVQRFEAALNLKVHIHALVLDAVYVKEQGTRFHEAEPPADEEMDTLLLMDRAAPHSIAGPSWPAGRCDGDPFRAVAGRGAGARGRRGGVGRGTECPRAGRGFSGSPVWRFARAGDGAAAAGALSGAWQRFDLHAGVVRGRPAVVTEQSHSRTLRRLAPSGTETSILRRQANR